MAAEQRTWQLPKCPHFRMRRLPLPTSICLTAVFKNPTLEQRAAVLATRTTTDAVRLDQLLDLIESVAIDGRLLLAGKRGNRYGRESATHDPCGLQDILPKACCREPDRRKLPRRSHDLIAVARRKTAAIRAENPELRFRRAPPVECRAVLNACVPRRFAWPADKRRDGERAR